jgi:threonine/homoserine/homoserine lactone efflux protein
MTSFTVAIVVGFLAGFLGAIPPGPINVTVIRKSSLGDVKGALRVALGGALIDTLICGLIGLGFGWLLAVVMTKSAVKVVLALFLIGYGLKILLADRKREAANGTNGVTGDHGSSAIPEAAPRKAGFNLPFLVGILQGAANPALFVNWTLLTGFLVGHRLLSTGPGPAAGFALGIGVGVFSWFVALAKLVEHLRNHPAGEWIRKSTTVAGVLLVAFGLFFGFKTVLGF